MKKKFILCLGNQKSGTTWLFRNLAKSANYARGFTKEYHIFDYKDIAAQRRKIENVRKGLARNIINIRSNARLSLMRQTDWYYFRYFNRLLRRNKMVTGDITPSYSALKRDRLKSIDKAFNDLGIEVVPVVLFRDPFTRIKSSVQMNFESQKNDVGFNTTGHDFDASLLDYYQSEHCKLRTSYKETLTEARAAFGDRLGVFFYENLFSQETILRLSKHCGVEFQSEFSQTRINPSKNKFPHRFETENEIRIHFADQYDYFENHYPETKGLWSN